MEAPSGRISTFGNLLSFQALTLLEALLHQEFGMDVSVDGETQTWMTKRIIFCLLDLKKHFSRSDEKILGRVEG
jgi:hypothetical protein